MSGYTRMRFKTHGGCIIPTWAVLRDGTLGLSIEVEADGDAERVATVFATEDEIAILIEELKNELHAGRLRRAVTYQPHGQFGWSTRMKQAWLEIKHRPPASLSPDAQSLWWSLIGTAYVLARANPCKICGERCASQDKFTEENNGWPWDTCSGCMPEPAPPDDDPVFAWDGSMDDDAVARCRRG